MNLLDLNVFTLFILDTNLLDINGFKSINNEYKPIGFKWI